MKEKDLPLLVEECPRHFDPTVNQSSRVTIDLVRVVHSDEKGKEYVTFEPFDSASYQKELGPVENWDLQALLKAGVDPRFVIHTNGTTRMDTEAQLNEFASVADSLNNEINNSKTE